MNYDVHWESEAADELQEMYFSADPALREKISASYLEVESALSNAPKEIGESRDANVRIAFVGCLAIQYGVDEASRRVEVFRIRLTRAA